MDEVVEKVVDNFNAPAALQRFAAAGSAAQESAGFAQAGRAFESATAIGSTYFPEDADAARRFDQLADEVVGDGDLRPQHGILIANIVRGEYLAEKLKADIDKRGMGETARNGRQTYWRENKSVNALMKLMEQQRRTLQALGLIARSSTGVSADDDDDGDFEKF